MKSQSKRFPKAPRAPVDEEDSPLQQKPLSKKELSLKFYEPPAQFRHLLTLRGSKVVPTKQQEDTRPTAAAAATGNVPFVRSSTASTAPADDAGCSDRTLPADESSASSMSDNDDDDDVENNNREESSSSSTNSTKSYDEDQVVSNASAEQAACSKKEESSMARLLKKSLRHLDEIIQSTISKHHKETKLTTKKKSSEKQKKNGKKLIPETGFFSNNHVMVNRERALVDDLKPLHRSRYLDSLALSHAVDMADAGQVEHLVERSADLKRLLQSNEVGENVQRGTSIRDMHTSAMKSDNSRMRNILRSAYTEFGMGTAVGKADGKLYMVQLFRGPTTTLQENKSQQEPEPAKQEAEPSEVAPASPMEEEVEEEPDQIAQ